VVEKTIIIFRKQKNLKLGLFRFFRFFKKPKNLGFLKATSTARVSTVRIRLAARLTYVNYAAVVFLFSKNIFSFSFYVVLS